MQKSPATVPLAQSLFKNTVNSAYEHDWQTVY